MIPVGAVASVRPRTSVYLCLLPRPTHGLLTPRACSGFSRAIGPSRKRHGSAGQTHVEPVPGAGQEHCQGPGHIGVDGRHRGRPRRPDRRCGRDVHVRGPRRCHASLRVGAAGGAAAEDDHARRGRQRARHRVHVVSQRPSARVGAGDGHPDRHRRRANRVARPTRRPVPCVPEFLWDARLFGSSQDRAGTRQTVRRAQASTFRIAAQHGRHDGPHHRDRRPGRRAHRLPRRRGVQRR